jgi:hypothetical protein
LKRIFCTVFDKNYLYQGISLYNSLLSNSDDFKLYSLCMDEISFELIKKMKLDHLIPVHLDEIMNNNLINIKKKTTHGQFCWVCQPLIIEYLLLNFSFDMVTYLETDSMFFDSPEIIFEEMGESSVTLVPHNYSHEFDNTKAAGVYCVQFNAFKNNQQGLEVLSYWKESCFQYDKNKLTKYPGQTNLDNWCKLFDCVKVIENIGAGVAPWNIRGYELKKESKKLFVNNFPVIFYHYHSYSKTSKGMHDLGSYPMNSDAIELFYKPYINNIKIAKELVFNFDKEFSFERLSNEVTSLKELVFNFSIISLKTYMTYLKRKIRKRYNVYSDEFFDY